MKDWTLALSDREVWALKYVDDGLDLTVYAHWRNCRLCKTEKVWNVRHVLFVSLFIFSFERYYSLSKLTTGHVKILYTLYIETTEIFYTQAISGN